MFNRDQWIAGLIAWNLTDSTGLQYTAVDVLKARQRSYTKEEGVKLLVAHILEKSFGDAIQLDGPA